MSAVLCGRSLGTPQCSYGRGCSGRCNCAHGLVCVDISRQLFDRRVDLVVPAVDNHYAVLCDRAAHWRGVGLGSLMAKPMAAEGRLTIGSSDRGCWVFGEPRRESMIGINQIRLWSTQPRVAQPLRNSRDVGPRFHSMSVQHFTACRPPVSDHVGPPFHGVSVQFMR